MVKFGNLNSIFRKQPLHFLPLPLNDLMFYVNFLPNQLSFTFNRNIAELVRNVEHKISVLFIHQDFLANSSDRACERLTRLQTGKGFIFIMTAQLWCFKDRCNYDYEQQNPLDHGISTTRKINPSTSTSSIHPSNYIQVACHSTRTRSTDNFLYVISNSLSSD